MLTLSRKKRESIMIGDDIEVTVLRISGSVVSIGIKAPREVNIVRKEIAGLRVLLNCNQEREVING